MVIYKITNKVNGKIYIGQTVQKLKDRWANHKSDARNSGKTPLYKSMRKYGIDNFSIEIIDYAQDLDSLNLLEQEYIKVADCLVPKGYNLLPGGENHRHHEVTRAKLSALNKGKPIKNRWTEGNSTPCTEETKIKISDKLKGRPIKARWTGGNRTPRTKAQKLYLSQLNKGKPNTALYKKVICIDTGVIYSSVNEAADIFEVNRVTISSLIKSGKKGRLGVSFKFYKEDA